MRELVRIVAREGLRLHAAHLGDDVRGLYSPAEKRIYFDLKLTYNERRSTIAHELGHHRYGHDCSSEKNERQADAYAARLLIHPDDYRDAVRVNPDREHVADELCVTLDVVEAYEAYCLSRLGEVVYDSAALGGSRWRSHAGESS